MFWYWLRITKASIHCNCHWQTSGQLYPSHLTQLVHTQSDLDLKVLQKILTYYVYFLVLATLLYTMVTSISQTLLLPWSPPEGHRQCQGHTHIKCSSCTWPGYWIRNLKTSYCHGRSPVTEGRKIQLTTFTYSGTPLILLLFDYLLLMQHMFPG